MYEAYFGLSERPFSIAPDPHYLYMSEQHKEAMAHLRYGVVQGGGFILLTGEVGTGKTTLCRNLLNDLPDGVDVALILNADLQKDELLQTVCDELDIDYTVGESQKSLLDRLNQHLLDSFANDRKTVLIIDEAQLLAPEVLEQVRLLTNLETTKTKLLQIILIGQPELTDVLQRRDLRQLAQRITARYHLRSINKVDLADYVNYRLKVAGCVQPLFTRQALHRIHKLTNGIPRLINVLCDHALLVAYANNSPLVNAKMVRQASAEMMLGDRPAGLQWFFGTAQKSRWLIPGVTALLLVGVMVWQWPAITGQFSTRNDNPVASTANDPVPVSDTTQPASESNTEANSTADGVATQSPTNNLSNADEGRDLATTALATGVPTPTSETADQDASDERVTDTGSDNISRSTNLSDAGAAGRDVLSSTILAELLDAAAGDTSRVQAFRYLALLWDKPLPGVLLNSLCEEVRKLQLSCFGNEGASLTEVQQYNRPTILVLTTASGEHRAILKGINDVEAELQIGETDHTVALTELRQHWTGRYLLFWQPPDIGYQILIEGADSPAVVWLRQQLHFALRSNNLPGLDDTSNSVYDAGLTANVQQLQSRYGLVPDGQVGIRTYLLLNEMLNAANTPTLASSDRDDASTNRQ